MVDASNILMSDEASSAPQEPEAQSEGLELEGLDPQERAGAIENALRGAQAQNAEGNQEPIEAELLEGDETPEKTSEPDEFDAKFAALQAKAEAERARVAARKQTEVKAIDLRKKEEELASVAYRVLEAQKEANAALSRVEAYEKMSSKELVYEAMLRAGGDANAVAEAFLEMNDPATIAGLQAKRREAETVNPLQKRLDDLERRIAAKDEEVARAQSQAQMYAEIGAAASMSQQHANEVPHVAKLASRNQQLFQLRFRQAQAMLMQEHGQAPTGNVLLQMEADLAPELNEIRETFGWGESPSDASGSSRAVGGVKPKIVTNRAASQRTQVAEEGDDLPRDPRERARLLERRMNGG